MSIPPIPGDKRLTVFPIGRSATWAFVKQAQKCYWVVEEIDFSKDREHYTTRLTADERHFVDHILAFFASGDRLVNINLAERFKRDAPILEIENFYDLQLTMENIHAEAYAMQLDTIVPTAERRSELLASIENNPAIGALCYWIRLCTESTDSYPARLLKMACVEGIFFSGCFCAIYWLQSRGKMPGLAHANELIARDEGLHTQFALHLYKLCDVKLSDTEVQSIFGDAVRLAEAFTRAAMPKPLAEMNSTLLTQYIKSIADGLMQEIGVPPLYRQENPFQFMKQLEMVNRTNFFERRVSEYSKTNAAAQNDEW